MPPTFTCGRCQIRTVQVIRPSRMPSRRRLRNIIAALYPGGIGRNIRDCFCAKGCYGAAMSLPPRMNGADWAILLILSVLWGGSFFFIEIALPTVAPFTLVLIRVAVAAAMLWTWLLARRERLSLPRGAALDFLVLALLNNVVPFVLFAWAQQAIDGGLASILNATTPI